MQVWSFVVDVVRFLYRFIVGDDWRVALAVVLGLVASGFLFAHDIRVWWVVPVIAIGQTWFSLRRSRQPQPSPTSGQGR